MSNQEHAPFSPSMLSMHLKCNASWQEKENRPEPEQTQYASKGSLLHDYVVRAYHKGKSIVQELKDSSDRIYVLQCLDYIDEVISHCAGPVEIFLEQRVSLEPYGLPLIWGTADVIISDRSSATVHVIDWKFGSGVQVFAPNNQQGIAYMAGAIVKYPAAKAYFHIFQPTLSHVDSIDMDKNDIDDHVERVFKSLVVSCMADNPSYNPSVEACRFCRANIECVARHEHQLSLAQKVFAVEPKELPSVSDEQIAEFLKIAPELTTYINNIKEYAYNRLKRGHKIPDFKLVQGRANRKFLDWKKMEEWMIANTIYSYSDFVTTKQKGPAGIEKLDKSLKSNPDFQALIYKGEGSLSVVPEKDKRAAYIPIHAASNVFKKYDDEDNEVTE